MGEREEGRDRAGEGEREREGKGEREEGRERGIENKRGSRREREIVNSCIIM